MKKYIIIIFLLSIATINLSAQSATIKVTSGGDVGVGTDTPDEKLEVAGNTKTEGIVIERPFNSAAVSCERLNASAFAFGAGAHAGFTVDRNYHLDFRSNARSFVVARSISTGILMLRFKKLTGYAGFGGVGNPATSIHTNGSITYNGGLFNASDERLKQNISEMNYGLKEVLQLNPVTYQYNGKAGIPNVDKTHFGLKAQNLQKVAPGLVSTFTYEEEDAESKIVNSEEYLMIEESAIKYMLVNAMKEQQDIIEDQATKLTKLENELAEIKKLLTTKSGKNTRSQNIEINGLDVDKGSLGQNVPNPHNGNTQIEYYLPENIEKASIAVYDNVGKFIKEIAIQSKGGGQIDLMMNNLPSGVYHYKLMADGKTMDSKQMVLD